MRAQLAASLLALAARVHAIEITSPAKNAVIDPTAGVTVKWTTVSTDPSHAHLALVNMASGHTPFSLDLGDVDLSKGSLTVSAKDVPADEGYQFNFESVDSGSTGILAQSQQFEVKAGSDDSSSSSSSASSASSSSSASSQSSSADSSASATTATAASSTATVTSGATTLTTTAASQTGSVTGSATRSSAAASSTSTGAAAPTGRAVQGGSFLALIAGLAVVVA